MFLDHFVPRHLVLVAVLGAAPLAAQTWQPAPRVPVAPDPGTYTYFGTGCGPGTNPGWWSQLTATGAPVLGGTVTVRHSIPQPGRGGVLFGYLFTGLSATEIGGIPLPLDLKILGWAPGRCFLYTSAEFASWGGGGPRTFRIPNDPTLLGLALYQQWWVFMEDRFAWPQPAMWQQVSNGGIMTIGLP